MAESTIDPRLLQFLAPMGTGLPFSFGYEPGTPGMPMQEQPMPAAMDSGEVSRFSALPNYGVPQPAPSFARMVADAATAGTWPYMAAGLKQATGYDEGKDFGTLRRQEQREVARAREQYDNWNDIANVGIPFALGGRLGAPAKTLPRAVMRGAGAGAAYGATRGYLEPIEPDVGNVAERLPGALTGGIVGSIYGGVGGASPYAVRKGRQKLDEYWAGRTADREAREIADEGQRVAKEWQDRLEADEAAKLRSDRSKKAVETRQRNKQLEAEQAAKDKRTEGRSSRELAKRFEAEYDKFPASPPANWKANREAYAQDRTSWIAARVAAGRDLRSIATSLKLKPAQIARYAFAHRDRAPWNQEKYQQFVADVLRIVRAEAAYKARPPKPKN